MNYNTDTYEANIPATSYDVDYDINDVRRYNANNY